MTPSSPAAPVRLARFLLIAAGGCLLAWLAFRAAAVRTLPPDSPLLAAIAPSAPDEVLERALSGAETGRGAFDDRAYAAIARAAQALPLDERPFFLVALRALAAGQEKRGLALLEEARHRNPRFRIARLVLLDRWLRDGDIRRATQEMTVLSRLLPSAGDVLATELARLATTPATSAATRQALSRDPALLDRVLGLMARRGISPTALARFAGSGAPAGLEDGGWRRTLIDTLVTHGEYAPARKIWADAHHVPRAARTSPIFDAGFTGQTATPPFSWTVSGNEVGAATIGKGVMAVEYYGRRSGDLASQLVVIAPGAYRLRVTVEGLDSGDGSSLGWTLTCAGATATPLLATPPVRIGPTPRTLIARFAVPATGCGAQWLRLVGTAGEFAAPVSARIRALSIEGET